MTTKLKIGFLELICIFIVITSFVSVLSLVLNKFNPYVSIALSFLGFLLFLIIYRKSISIRFFTISNFVLFLILLLAMIFRFQPYFYVVGLDSITYMMMSDSFIRTGSPFDYSTVHLKINDSRVLKVYDENNHVSGQQFYYNTATIDKSQGKYEFRFPPLHALWMSLFSFLGDQNRAYSLTLFSLLSIAVFFFIGLELFNGKMWAGIIVGVLLAVNPMHSFFSKMTYSEIPALFFLFSSLFFLLKYYNSELNSQNSKTIHLVLSASLMGCFFFTRITGFIYVPFFYFLAAITCLYLQKSKNKTKLMIYFGSIPIFYVLSLIYSYNFNKEYTREILLGWILPKFIGGWTNLFVICFLLIAVLYVLCVFQKSNRRLIIKIRNILKQNAGLILFIIFCIIVLYFGVYKTKLLETFTIGAFPEFFFKKSGLFIMLLYMTLPVFILSFPSIYILSRKDFRFFALCSLIVLLLFCYLFNPERPITTYQNKYYIESIVPAFLLLFSCLLGYMIAKNTSNKILVFILFLSVAPISFYQSTFQWEGRNGEGSHEFLMEIADKVGNDDLLIIENGDKNYEFPYFWPVKYYLNSFYQKSTFAVRNIIDINNTEFSDYFQNYDDIFIITRKEINQTIMFNPELVSKLKFRNPALGIERIPYYFHKKEWDIFLYKLKSKKWPSLNMSES